jgi:predicted PurR-regulated permease PerM
VVDLKTPVKKEHFILITYAFLIIALAIIMNKVLGNFSYFTSFVNRLYNLILPFVFGFSFAFIINPAVKFFEKYIFNRKKEIIIYSRRNRILSVIIVYVIFFGIISIMATSLVPKMASSLLDLVKKTPDYLINFRDYVFVLLDKYGFSDSQGMKSSIDKYVNLFLEQYDINNIQFYLDRLKSGVISVTTSMYNVVFGIIISLYFILDKEKFIKGTKRIFRALLPEKGYKLLAVIIKDCNRTFSKFIIGKAIDSLIIGIICFFGLLLLRIKYPILISVIIAITNMIPYFGPFIGAIPAVIITLLSDPLDALWVAIYILILQQFDGWILGPKIMGDTVGLSPVWIILAIIIGGGFFGFIGMILGVPTIAVIKIWLDRYIDKKDKEKTSI